MKGERESKKKQP